MSGLAILAVDDEAPALDELSYLLDSSPLVDRVTVAKSATDGLRKLRDGQFDVVLLDVRMPGLDGMELARVLGRFADPPAVIFVTAYEAHALEAFDVGAAGYLLKPVDAERLDRVLRRAIGARAGTAELTTAPEDGSVIAVEAGNRTILFARSDITWIESAGDYVRLHLRDGASHLLRTPMAVLEEQWGDYGFVRIHRSYLVSLRDITELTNDGSHTSVHVAGRELPVSRRHVRDLHDVLVRHSRPPNKNG